MNESYLLLLMLLGPIFGYFVSRGAREELKELHIYLKYAYIITAAIAFGVAAYYNIFVSLIVSFVSLVLLYFYNGKIAQVIVLFLCGTLIFLVKETFLFSVVLFINLMIYVSLNYKQSFLKNIYSYIYFLIPASIVLILKILLRV